MPITEVSIVENVVKTSIDRDKYTDFIFILSMYSINSRLKLCAIRNSSVDMVIVEITRNFKRLFLEKSNYSTANRNFKKFLTTLFAYNECSGRRQVYT